jgi:fructose-1,6-bisphosphatase/inositol monophosphatase family enzyme
MTFGSDGALHDQVIEALRVVGETIVLPRFNRLAEGDVRAKAHAGDLVTIADEESEAELGSVFRRLIPDSVIVGEEGVHRDKAVLDFLGGPAPVWIIDPVDGTKNFVGGVGRFAMIVALARGKETVMAWIHDPLAGETLAAERGAGTWRFKLGRGGERLRIPPSSPELSQMITAHHHRAYGPHLGKFHRNVHLGSAAHDYWAAVDGRVQIITYRRLRPWDHAAGVLIHKEAGGYNGLLNGEPYRPVAESEGLVCAPTADAWARVAALAAGFKG